MSNEFKPPEIYLGDSVYLTGDGMHLILSTNSHKPEDWDQVIYLDDNVERGLYNYLKSIYEVQD